MCCVLAVKEKEKFHERFVLAIKGQSYKRIVIAIKEQPLTVHGGKEKLDVMPNKSMDVYYINVRV